MEKYSSEIKTVKRRKFTAIAILVFLCAFALVFARWDVIIIGVHYSFGFIPGPGVIAIFIFALLLYFILYVRIAMLVGKYLLDECDPEKYLAVYSAFVGQKRFLKPGSKFLLIRASALINLGKFDEAEALFYPMPNFKPLDAKMTFCKIAFLRNDRAAFEERYEEVMKNLNATPNATSSAALMRNEKDLTMLHALVTGDLAAATAAADELRPLQTSNLPITVCDYDRALVYRAAHDDLKAIGCLRSVSERGGKTFYKTVCDRLLAGYAPTAQKPAEEKNEDGDTQ